LSTIFDNHQLLIQYAERDPAEEQWRSDAADQHIKYQYLSTPSQGTQFAWKPNDPHEWDSSKNLENTNLSEYEVKKAQQETQGGFSRKLAFQLLTR
jgi:hypothetical protein